MNFRHSVMGALVIVIVYLFVSAPAPLPDGDGEARGNAANVRIEQVFDALNFINAKTRQIYTDKIVSRGQEAGLKFGEHWLDDGVEAGPLPALFLRLTATNLEKRRSPLGLFLGSHQPINQANYFKGEQVVEFEKMQADRKPRFFPMERLGIQVSMYPDIASAKGCVTCHNEHKDSPKKDWILNDVMGATVWTYPRAQVSQSEARRLVSELYLSIKDGYEAYLKRTSGFREPVAITTEWPARGNRRLPDTTTFMNEVFAATGPDISRRLLVEIHTERQP